MLYETSGKRKVRMVSCHICYIYGILRSKEVRGCFKVIIGVANRSYKGLGSFNEEIGVSTMQYRCIETLF